MKNIILPTKQHIEWADCELGALIHMDLQTFFPYNFRDDLNFHPSLDIFNPKMLDTDQWVESAVEMGAKYIVLVAKHCTGFSLWPTKVHEFSIKNTPYKNGNGDIVGDFINSCRKYNVKPGLYYSTSANAYYGVSFNGRPEPDSKTTQEEYNRAVLAQLTELWTNYDELFEIWFDGGCLPVEDGGPDITTLLHKLQPNAVVFQGPVGTKALIRWVGNERGTAPVDCFATIDSQTFNHDGTTETNMSGNPYGDSWQPAESDMPNRNPHTSYLGGWFWHEGEEHTVIPAEELLECYYTSVGHNTNHLIGMVIDRDGRFPEKDTEEFKRFGAMVRERFSNPIAQTMGENTTITLDLPCATYVRDIVICEDIQFGERITEYHIDSLADGKWEEIASACCIGHKRIHRVEKDNIEKIRLVCTKTKAVPKIKLLAAY